MTVEEALLAAVGLVALVLLFLGLSEVLEGDARARLRARRRELRLREPRRAAPETAPARPPLARRPRSARVATEPMPVAEPEPRPPAAADDWRDGVAALLRAREFGEARRLIDPALRDGRAGSETVGALLDVCSSVVARDLRRLRRAVRRSAGDEAVLVASMETTRVLLESRPAAALPAQQRRHTARRLWRGQARLGLRRWRAGDFDAAVETLFQALSVPGIDERRGRVARELLVRTLEDMAGQSLELIPQLLGEGDRAAALEQAQRLLVHIRRARDEGVSPEDLAVAASRARQLLEHIEQAP